MEVELTDKTIKKIADAVFVRFRCYRQPKMLTTKEAAEILRLSERHVRRLAREGKIPCVKQDGGRLLFEKKVVDPLVIGL